MVTGLLIIFVALSGFLSWKLVRQQRALRLLGHEWRALQAEEKQVFEFLRGLGESFGSGAGHRDLHRLIVESGVRILNAHGGALYERAGMGAAAWPVTANCIMCWATKKTLFSNSAL